MHPSKLAKVLRFIFQHFFSKCAIIDKYRISIYNRLFALTESKNCYKIDSCIIKADSPRKKEPLL